MFPLNILRNKSHDHIHYLRTLKGVLGMLTNPEGTESVFDIEDGLKDIEAARGVVDRVRRDPEVIELMEARYLADPVDIEALDRMSEGTLGKAFAQHILKNGFDPDYYRKIDVTADQDWVFMRMRQTHDIWHVVTGIDTSRHGELAVKAFELAQTWRPLAAVITCGGMLRFLFKDPDQLGAVMAHIAHGYSLGRNAQPFLAQRWEDGWQRPLLEWRADVGVPADPNVALRTDLAAMPAPAATREDGGDA